MNANGAIGDERGDRWSIRERQAHMDNISDVVRISGHKVMEFAQQVKDTRDIHGHSSSTIDAYAQQAMTNTFQEVYDGSEKEKGLGNWAFHLDYEDAAVSLSAQAYFPTESEKARVPVAIIDEIDGTTNVKRAVAAPLLANKNPKSAVCIALKRNRESSEIECGAS